MLDAISAETLKMTRHKATWFLVWLYPVGFLAAFLIAILVGLAGAGGDVAEAPPLDQWISETAAIWELPDNPLGRFLISAYVAVVFAGEYGWNTWKLIVPHRSRFALVAAKFALIVALFAVAYALTAMITVLMTWLEDVVTGDPLPAGISAAGLLEAHGKGALAALAPALLTIAYTSLAAVLTRSMIAALVIGIVVATAEQLFVDFGALAAAYLPGLVWTLYHALPGYHLANLVSWIGEGSALRTPFPDGSVVALPWATSLAVAAAWSAALTAATFAAFKRQDIN